MKARDALIIAAKVLGFAIITLWILSTIAIGLLLLPMFVDGISEHWSFSGWGDTFLTVWFGITLVAIGALVASKAMRIVGKWERPNGEK